MRISDTEPSSVILGQTNVSGTKTVFYVRQSQYNTLHLGVRLNLKELMPVTEYYDINNSLPWWISVDLWKQCPGIVSITILIKLDNLINQLGVRLGDTESS